jgi:TolA-binding protein
MAGNYSRWLSEPQNTTGEPELDEAERKVRNAKFENATERVDQISEMEHKVAKWQQLNRILNTSDEILPDSERNKFECMRRDLEGSKEVQAFLREAKTRDLRERKRGAGS